MAASITKEQPAGATDAPSLPLGRRARLRLPGVPILNYHGLCETLLPDIPSHAQRFWLAPSQMRAHLEHLRERGIRVAVLEELETLPSPSTARNGTVAVTFDDGLASDYESAFPLLGEFGVRGVFFLNPSTVGGARYLSWPQVAEMSRAGMSIESHSYHHLDLTVLPGRKLERELAESKRALEDRLGHAVDFLAAPHGLLNRRVVRSALACGYRAVASTRAWPAKPRSQVLTRITLHRDLTLDDFDAFVTGAFPFTRAGSAAACSTAREASPSTWRGSSVIGGSGSRLRQASDASV